MSAKASASKLFGDFGHTVRTLIIASAATAVATWGYNTFIKNPVGNLADVGKHYAELTQLRADFDAYKTSEKDRWAKRQQDSKELNDKVMSIQVDVAWLKGRVK